MASRKSHVIDIHPDDIDRVKDFCRWRLSHGAAYELEMRVRRGAVETIAGFWFATTRCATTRDRSFVGILHATDIEDRKRAEERLQQENVALREEIDKASMFEEIVGASPALKAVLSRVSKVAASDSTVLITGETGTGKELVARAIHRRSRRLTRVRGRELRRHSARL